MIENVLHGIGGVGNYGVISICLFFAVFSATFIWAMCLKKPYLNTMRNLPLEDEAAPGHEPSILPQSPDRHE